MYLLALLTVYVTPSFGGCAHSLKYSSYKAAPLKGAVTVETLSSPSTLFEFSGLT